MIFFLHGIDCKKSATTEIKGADVIYMGYKRYMLMIVCVLSHLASLPLLGVMRKSWYII